MLKARHGSSPHLPSLLGKYPPTTRSIVEAFLNPAELLAMQVYFPLSSKVTAGMDRTALMK